MLDRIVDGGSLTVCEVKDVFEVKGDVNVFTSARSFTFFLHWCLSLIQILIYSTDVSLSIEDTEDIVPPTITNPTPHSPPALAHASGETITNLEAAQSLL